MQLVCCILCGDVASLVGVFVPHNSQQFGAAPGKQRFIQYPICEDCMRRGNTDAIEQKLIEQAA
jgi:hypothetical protein